MLSSVLLTFISGDLYRKQQKCHHEYGCHGHEDRRCVKG